MGKYQPFLLFITKICFYVTLNIRVTRLEQAYFRSEMKKSRQNNPSIAWLQLRT